ncbi:MAG: peptide-methionine (S)-S-oxide reductase MsrA, partial [Mycobacteriales bacterium]
MWLRSKPEMPTSQTALPGRTTPLPVPERHEALGTPLTPPWPEGMEVLYVAMGCFWGAERFFWKIPGVYTTAAGYTGGFTPNPTYEETCTGRTGHTEAVVVVYDPAEVGLDTLLQEFWENHDPTQRNGQGNDHGTQYRTAIYPTTDAQLVAVQASAERYQAALT